MAPIGSKDVRRTKTPHGRKVVFLPQSHYTDNMPDPERKATAKSQCIIAKKVYDNSLPMPRREGDLGLFMRRNATKILYIFVENEFSDSSLGYYHYFKKTSPDEFRKIQKAFPGRKLPPCNKVSPVQGDFLAAYGGAGIAQFLGRAVYIKGVTNQKANAELAKFYLKHLTKYGWLSRFGKGLTPWCSRFGKSEFRRRIFDSREENILRQVRSHKGKGLLYVTMSFFHVLDKYDGWNGLKIIVPRVFARFRKALSVSKTLGPENCSRRSCIKGAYKLNAALSDLKKKAIANPEDRADYIEKQQIVLDYLAEGGFPVLEVKTLDSLLNQSLKQRALKQIALVHATLTALKFTTRLAVAAFTLSGSELFSDQ